MPLISPLFKINSPYNKIFKTAKGKKMKNEAAIIVKKTDVLKKSEKITKPIWRNEATAQILSCSLILKKSMFYHGTTVSSILSIEDSLPHSDKLNSVGLLSMIDQLVAETST
jgi:hypothetical protein